MKKLILLTIICTLINGCGLFKKSSKEIDKHVEQSEQTINKQSNIDYLDQSKSLEVNTNVSTEASVNGYVITADTIKFNPDGSFEARGSVNVVGNIQWQKQQQDSTSKQVQADIKVKEEVKEEVKQSHEIKDYSKTTKSETDFWGIIAGACGVLVIVIGVIWGRGNNFE